MKKIIKILKQFSHNKLGWGYPTTPVHIGFVSVYKCECSEEIMQDSYGGWFHAEKIKNI